MYLGSVINLVSKDKEDRDRERDHFITQFNHQGNEVSSHQLTARAKDWVRSQLTKPESAAFLSIQVRQCADGITRAAGTLQFDGTEKRVATAGFMIMFSSDELLRGDLTDFDPIISADRMDEWLAFVDPDMGKRHCESSRLFWKVFWGIFGLALLGASLTVVI